MGRCYCTEIATCKYRISKLSVGIGVIDEISMSNIEAILKNITSCNCNCFTADNMVILNDHIQNLAEDMKQVRNIFKESMIDAVKRLEADMEEMEREDDWYHEEEDDEEYTESVMTNGREQS